MPDTDWTTMISRAEKLVRAAATELDGTRLHIVRASETAFADSPAFDAFVHPKADIWCREAIGQDWRGRAVCIVVSDEALNREPQPMQPDVAASWICHELAHVLVDGWWAGRDEAPVPGEEETARIVPAVAAHLKAPIPWKSEAQDKEVRDHGPAFLRAAIHLRRRIQAQGTYLAAQGASAGRYHWLQLIETYEGAIRDEPERLAGMRITDIIDLEPPPAFARLWEED